MLDRFHNAVDVAVGCASTHQQVTRVNTNNIHIHNINSPVNVLSKLDSTIQAIQYSPSLSACDQLKLVELLNTLKDCLANVPETLKDDAGLVIEQAEVIVEELKKPRPRNAALKIKWSDLIEAASALKSVVPAAINAAHNISPASWQMLWPNNSVERDAPPKVRLRTIQVNH